MAEPRDGPLQGSRLDAPPPLPSKLSDKKPVNLADVMGQPVGTPPTGELEQVVIEHAVLAEQILTSIGKMLPTFVPVAAQIIQSMRGGIVVALKQASASPQNNLAAGAGPVQTPDQGPPPPQGAAGPSGGAMPPPPAAQPSPVGPGPVQ